jgi:hypothetical protein
VLATIIQQEQDLSALLPSNRTNNSPSKALQNATNTWATTVYNAAKQLSPIEFTELQIDQALQFCQCPIFICGVHRSGTTLMRDLLDAHPALSVLPSEGTYITNVERKIQHLKDQDAMAFMCIEWLKRLANPINQPPYWILGNTSLEKSPYVDFTNAFISWWPLVQQHLQATNTMWPHLVLQLAYAHVLQQIIPNCKPIFWVDKTPTQEQHLTRLWRLFPNAKVLHVLRHPAAILASRKQMEPNTPLRVFVKDMQHSFRIATQQTALQNPRYLCVRYEDLSSNVDVTIAQIVSFLEIENLTSLTIPTVAGKPTQANSSFLQPQVAGKIVANNAEKPPKNLSLSHYQLLAATVGKLAFGFNYHLPETNPLQKFWAKLRYQVW